MIKERSLRVLGYGYRGPRQLTTSKAKVRKPADLKGLKIRVPEIAPMVATWRALGAAPTPMAWPEVFTALQTGTIEGQENPLEIINSSKLWEVQKYLHLTNHVRVAWIALIDERLWQKMTPATQKIMTATWREVADDLQKTVLTKEGEYLEAARKNGMTIVQEPELDVRSIRDALKDVWRDIAPKAWGPGVYERIQATT
jgi:TRAP-type C4-dicarboxylate transport system substrate-binding protein